MLKRKADSDNKRDDVDGDKKVRTAAAGASAQADDSDPQMAVNAALTRVQHTSHTAVNTLKLVDALKATDGSHAQRMQTVADLLKEDADRPESLLDLSLVVEGQSMLKFFYDCIPDSEDAADVKADKIAAEALINHVTPLLQKLLRSFDPTTVDVTTGNNALHQTCRLFILQDADNWLYKLTELLITRGVSLHTRNKQGRTPLLQRAAASSKEETIASGLRLLLARGSDLNVQDGDSNGLLHWLVENKAAALLEDLLSSQSVDSLDLTLRNTAGQTAAELAAFRLAEKSCSADSLEWRISRLLATQMAIWIKHAQPSSLRGLQAAMQPVGAAATADNMDSLDDDLVRARLAPRIATQTLKLMDAIKATGGSYSHRMQTVADLLKEDADRPESLLDLSLVVEGVKSCVLFQLFNFFDDCLLDDDDAADMKADKNVAQQLIVDGLLPLMPKLLRAFDPSTVDASTGNNALHEMCRLFYLHNVNCFSYKVTELLLAHGVSLHARNKKGRTPLLQWAANSSNEENTATGLRLLLSHGADPNAQDSDGDGLLHLVVQRKAANLLDNLFGTDVAGNLEHMLQNAKGQTAADLAAIQLAELQENPEGVEDEAAALQQQKKDRARHIHRLMAAQGAMWVKHARPALLCRLVSMLLVVDVAKLALGYIDGSGLTFDKAAEAESDADAEPAAAAATAAAAQS